MKHYVLNAVAIVGLLAGTPAYAAAAKPAVHPAQVSACTQAIGKSDRALAASKASSEDIAMAWQHMDAAQQARKAHQASACVSESQAALKLLGTRM
jgi:hypothetical protein